MKRTTQFRSVCAFALWALAVTIFFAPSSAKAQAGDTYTANAGAETTDQSVQADGFFPNELWILEGDSIKWTFVPKNELHTVTLLTPGQVRPPAPPPVGPPPPPIWASLCFRGELYSVRWLRFLQRRCLRLQQPLSSAQHPPALASHFQPEARAITSSYVSCTRI